jgi:hypothetical protein
MPLILGKTQKGMHKTQQNLIKSKLNPCFNTPVLILGMILASQFASAVDSTLPLKFKNGRQYINSLSIALNDKINSTLVEATLLSHRANLPSDGKLDELSTAMKTLVAVAGSPPFCASYSKTTLSSCSPVSSGCSIDDIFKRFYQRSPSPAETINHQRGYVGSIEAGAYRTCVVIATSIEFLKRK